MPCHSRIRPPLFASVTKSSRTLLFLICASASPQIRACRASLREISIYPSSFATSTILPATRSPIFIFLIISRAFKYSRPKMIPVPKGTRSTKTVSLVIAITLPSTRSPFIGGLGVSAKSNAIPESFFFFPSFSSFCSSVTASTFSSFSSTALVIMYISKEGSTALRVRGVIKSKVYKVNDSLLCNFINFTNFMICVPTAR